MKLHPKIRREQILCAALRIAERPGGWAKLTITAIAQEARCSYGLVCFHLGSIGAIRRETVKAAIKNENFDALIQALIANDPEANRMKPLLKQKAFAHIQSAGVS